MNADDAYEQHTDIVRALADPDSPASAAFTRFIESGPGASRMPGFRVLMEHHHMLAMGEQGAEHAQVAVVAEWEPAEIEDSFDLDSVGVEDPDAEQERHHGSVDAVAVPHDVYRKSGLHAMANAATFYVTRDMCALLEHAARSLDETDVMPRHPGHPDGFVVLAEPIRLPYGDGTEQVVHAFGWANFSEVRTVFGSVGQVGTVFQFADRVRAPQDREVLASRQDYPSKSSWARSPRLVLTMGDDFVVGAPVGAAVERVKSQTLDARRREAMRNESESDPGPAHPDGHEVGRFQPYLAAFLLLLTQQVTASTVRESAPDRVRRARQVGRRTERVTVVDLRRRTEPGGQDGQSGQRSGDRHYSVRHLVGGHWKWQAYGPERRLRRRIFVEGYVRGPESAPLVVKPRVFRI